MVSFYNYLFLFLVTPPKGKSITSFSSSGEDIAFSRRKRGFNSPKGYCVSLILSSIYDVCFAYTPDLCTAC